MTNGSHKALIIASHISNRLQHIADISSSINYDAMRYAMHRLMVNRIDDRYDIDDMRQIDHLVCVIDAKTNDVRCKEDELKTVREEIAGIVGSGVRSLRVSENHVVLEERRNKVGLLESA